MNKLSVSAAVVAYNNPEEVAVCLDSLMRETKGVALSLYVSDNSTDPEKIRALRQEIDARPGVTLLESRGNLGFGRGHNRVIPYLASDYHALVNPDILLQEDALSTMAAYMADHPDVALMMPEVLGTDGKRQYLPKKRPSWYYLIGGRLSKRIRADYCRSSEPMTGPTEIEVASGCFMLLPTALFKELGGFDERYFLYLEDADLSREAGKKGKVLFFPKARVTHCWHRASGKSLKALKLHFQSAGKYFRKWRKRT